MKNRKYVISAFEYVLDENGKVIDRFGGAFPFNDVDDFIMIWNYLCKSAPDKILTDEGEYMILQPREIVGTEVTEFQISGEAYKAYKKYEKKEKERYIKNNKEDLPF